MTQVVSEIGLRTAWALVVTALDPEDGLLWNFNLDAKRKRAVELLQPGRKCEGRRAVASAPFPVLRNGFGRGGA